VPALAGPSALAITVTLSATPDSILQDGGSQSSVVVNAIGPDGRARSGLALRLSMSVNGVAQDFGTLAARSIVTGNDGTARTTYTAPPAPPALAGGSGTVVSILATAVGTDAITSPASGSPSVDIRLVPPGIILPPASTPTARFTFTPTPVNFNIPVTFDASTSCAAGVDGGGNCLPTGSTIANYQWSFGDGGTASGRTATHTYVASTTPATSFTVTLTVTNDSGQLATTTRTVPVSSTSSTLTADFTFSPTDPSISRGTNAVIFDATPSTGAITSWTWDFGDGTAVETGQRRTHAFTRAGTWVVRLTVADAEGRTATTTKSVPVAQ